MIQRVGEIMPEITRAASTTTTVSEPTLSPSSCGPSAPEAAKASAKGLNLLVRTHLRTEVNEPAGAAPEDAVSEKADPELKRAIIEGVTARRYPVLVHGPTGRGKTFAVALFFWAWVCEPERIEVPPFWKLGYRVWYTGDNLLREIVRRKYHGGVKPLMSLIRDATLVVLDDIGMRKATDEQNAALHDVLECRRGKPLFVTTNLDEAGTAERPGLLQVFDDRVVSRLLAGTVVVTKRGKDMRLAAAKRVEV